MKSHDITNVIAELKSKNVQYRNKIYYFFLVLVTWPYYFSPRVLGKTLKKIGNKLKISEMLQNSESYNIPKVLN